MTETKELTTKANMPIVDGLIKPQDFNGLWRMAVMYADSGMVPKQFINNPARNLPAGCRVISPSFCRRYRTLRRRLLGASTLPPWPG